MSPRAIRAALLLGVVGLLVGVVVSLRRPGSKPAEDATGARASREMRTVGLVYTGYKEGQERWTLSAQALRSKDGEQVRLDGVKFSQGYVSQGQPGSVTIEADECVYAEAQERAVFRKNVRVTTADGFEMLTESLTYRGDRGVAKTDDPAQFRRKDVSGTSTGLDYDADTGKIVLPRDVVVHVNDPDQLPAEIRSRRAVADKRKGSLRFIDEVEASQGEDRLEANQLTLFFDADSRDLSLVIATGQVELRTAGSGALPGAAGGGPGQGTRVLKAQRLELRYRTDRTLQSAGAVGNADLTLLPGPRDRRERRRLTAHALDFDFDPQGLVERANGRKDAVFTVEPLATGQGPSQVVKADRFKARMVPGRNEAEEITFVGNVSFERGGQRATSNRARFTGADQLLRLSDDPQLVEDGSQLGALGIAVGTRSGDVSAKRDVRHVLRGRKGTGRSGLLSGDGGTLITSEELAYVAASRRATYTGEALLRSGKDEVRSQVLVLEEDAKGARTLTASPGVVSRLHPQQSAGGPGASPPDPVEGRAQEMVYTEAAGRIVYTGDVALKQGDILTKSPKATVSLTADGRGVDRLVAGEPVEVHQGARRATGRQAVYTPADETMLLTGDDVQLVDGLRTTRGRSLTFHVGDDTILVDGREEGRTETILKKEPSQR